MSMLNQMELVNFLSTYTKTNYMKKQTNPTNHLKNKFIELVGIDLSHGVTLLRAVKNHYSRPFNHFTVKSLLK